MEPARPTRSQPGRGKVPGRDPGLAKGTEVRSRRAALKQLMKRGKVNPYRVLGGEAGPEHERVARDMAVEALALAIPGVGPAILDDELGRLGIPPSVPLHGMMSERRRQLARALERRVVAS